VKADSGKPAEEPSTKPGAARQEARTCPVCGNEFSGAMEFCPVCMLRKGLAGAGAAGESSASEDAAKLTSDQSPKTI